MGAAGYFRAGVQNPSLTAMYGGEKSLKYFENRLGVEECALRRYHEYMIEKATSKDHPQTLDERFRLLVARWKSERGATSSATQMAMHPAYQRLIGLGPEAVPLLLRELQREPDHWFWALGAITGENPVPPEARGNLTEMAKAWLEWGRRKGII